MDQLARGRHPAYLFCCETHQKRRRDLSARLDRAYRQLNGRPITYEVLGSNDDPNLPLTIAGAVSPGMARGLILADPNGADVPTANIRRLLALPGWRGVDVLLHISATIIKRARGVALGNSSKAGQFARWRTISVSGMMDAIPKQCWWITQPVGHDQWIFLFGTNWNAFPGLARYGFVRVESACGQAWLHHAEEVNGDHH